MTVLTGVDVQGIQRFVFSSNRLRDVLAASWLVRKATQRGTLEESAFALRSLGIEGNALVAAGGNIILELPDMAAAKRTAGELSRWLINHAPGLDVVFAHHDRKSGELLASSIQKLFEDLGQAKLKHIGSAPMESFGVAAVCRQTGQTATWVDLDNDPIAESIHLGRDEIDDPVARWDVFLPAEACYDREPYFPSELDELGRSFGDTSLIAVVHVDVNELGRKLTDWLSAQGEAGDGEVRSRYREVSDSIDSLGEAALRAVVERVRAALSRNARNEIEVGGKPKVLSFELRSNKQTVALPIRPILLGGDDLTFICDGRLGLDLAATALRAIAGRTVDHLGAVGACAGVAIVHAHAPFHRAAALAETLCRSAKTAARAREASFALDWQVGLGHPGEALKTVRERQYGRFRAGRPFLLDGPPGMTWNWFNDELLGNERGGLRDEVWSGRRNKVKALPPIVRLGREAVRASLTAWRGVDDRIALPQLISSDGFGPDGVTTPLLDAVELLDLHLDLGR